MGAYDDIIPPLKGGTIKDIDIETSDRRDRQEKRAQRRIMYEEGEPVQKSKWLFWLLGGFVLIFVASFVVISMSIKSLIIVTPKTDSITLSQKSFTAYSAPEEDELGFSAVTVTETKSESVTATGKKKVERQASGTITVYNNFGYAQRLIKNTRFENEEGKIYRIRNSIIVPALKESLGKKTPGSVTATVYADVAGEAYNINSGKFTIPGLKGTDKYEGFYAESGPISGGFIGEEAVVDDKEIARVSESLRTAIREMAKQSIQKSAPDGSFIPSSGILVTFDETSTVSKDKDAIITETATARAISFDKNKLSRALLDANKPDYPKGDVITKDIDSLAFSFTKLEDIFSTGVAQFSVSGSSTIIWKVDVAKLASDLAGKSDSDFSVILINHPGVKDITSKIRPFWKSSFPSENKIKVKVNAE